MSNRYFYINDLQLVAKLVNANGYLYINKTWVDDKDSIIQHRLTGYCPILKTTGNPHMLVKIDEITQDEAQRLLNLF